MSTADIVGRVVASLEALAIAFVVLGALAALWRMVRMASSHHRIRFSAARLDMARFLSMALEFQLGADIVETTYSPGWVALGKLAAIAAIRTALNYFLSREMDEERKALDIGPLPAGPAAG